MGKGKTARPYSHLYDALKTHSRLHNKDHQEKTNTQGKKISSKFNKLNYYCAEIINIDALK